ncbi:MAG TPA: hypothetical protein PKZ00_01770, partial [Elusimicrobiota bacterium]|nr:hypothetical protein [Elusimicrobiota bacterium]
MASFSMSGRAEDTYTAGNAYLQRSFIDYGGDNQQDGNGDSYGSVNFMETRTDELTLAQAKNLPGPEGFFLYPYTPTGIVITTDTDTQLSVNWRSQNAAAGHYGAPTDKFQVRYSSQGALTPISFATATVFPGLVDGGFPAGQLVGPITLPGLQYDTTYYIGVVGLDDEYARNQSLLLAGLRCTLGPTPVVNSAIADEVLLTVTVDVDLFNTRTGHSIKWQARIAEDAGFSVNVTTNGVKTTINPTDTDVFTGRSAGKTYYTQARTINQAGAPSPWSPTKVAVFRNGIPVMTAIPS